jgi:hypothetical protein
MSEQLQPESQTNATNRIVRQSQERRQRAKIPIPRPVSLVENAFSAAYPSEQANNTELLATSSTSSTPELDLSTGQKGRKVKQERVSWNLRRS